MQQRSLLWWLLLSVVVDVVAAAAVLAAVVALVVVVVDVVGSVVEANARGPTCRFYWFLHSKYHSPLLPRMTAQALSQ